jgi:hypothetical protein
MKLSEKQVKEIEKCDYIVGNNWECDCKVEVEGKRVRVTTKSDGREISELYDVEAITTEEYNQHIYLTSQFGDLVELF